MLDVLKKRWATFGWGAIASVVLHLLVVAAFFIKIPDWTPKPEEDQAVNVELVPPPEEKQPEEKKPPALKLEEKKPAEKPPEPPKAEKQAPPPPPKPPEKEPPKAETDEGRKPENPAARPQSMPVLRPVFQFGDKDIGPRKSETGDSPVEGERAETPQPKPAPATPPPSPPVTTQKVEDTRPPGNPVPDDVQLPKVAAAEVHPAENGSSSPPSDKPGVSLETMKPADRTQADAKPMPDAAKPAPLPEAKRLYSQSETGSAEAQTAMGDLPRSVRVDQLCSTELREQLRHGSPPINPEMLPAYRLLKGTVLEVRRAAFRANSRWYNLGFRCEIDADATKVLSFAFDVGDPIPRSEWKARRLPGG